MSHQSTSSKSSELKRASNKDAFDARTNTHMNNASGPTHKMNHLRGDHALAITVENTIDSQSNAASDCEFQVSNNAEWYKQRIKFNADAKNNLYFRVFPDSIASFILRDILITKWFAIFICVLFVTIVGIGETIIHTKAASASKLEVHTEDSINVDQEIDDNDILFIPHSLAFGIGGLVSVLLLFAANIELVKLISKTFDFWYKCLNLIMFNFAFVVLGLYTYCWKINGVLVIRPIYYIGITVFAQFAFWLAIFMLDAMTVSSFSKKIFVFASGLYFIFNVVTSYFFKPDVIYTPFESLHNDDINVVISFKGIFVSSFVNMILFAFKTVYRQLKTCNCKCQNNTKLESQKCSLIYKKPDLIWVNDEFLKQRGQNKSKIRDNTKHNVDNNRKNNNTEDKPELQGLKQVPSISQISG